MNQDTDIDDEFDDDFDTLDDDADGWDADGEDSFDAPPPKKKSPMGLVLTLVILGGLGGAGYVYKDTVMTHIGPYIGQSAAPAATAEALTPAVDTPAAQTADMGTMPAATMAGMPDSSAMDMANDPFASGTSEPLTDIPEIGFGLPSDPAATVEQAVAVDDGLDGFEGVETVGSASNIDGMPPQPGDEAPAEMASSEMEIIPEDISFGADTMSADTMATDTMAMVDTAEQEIESAMDAMPTLTDDAVDMVEGTVEEIEEIDALPTMSSASRSSADIEKIEDLEDQIAELRKENEKLSAENKKLARQVDAAGTAKAASASSASSKTVSKPQPRRAAVSKAINWEIRSASKGRALISAKGKNDMVTIREGQRVDGLGVVKKIEFVPGQGWQISTAEGRIIR